MHQIVSRRLFAPQACRRRRLDLVPPANYEAELSIVKGGGNLAFASLNFGPNSVVGFGGPQWQERSTMAAPFSDSDDLGAFWKAHFHSD